MKKRRCRIQLVISSYLIVFLGLPVYYSLDNSLNVLNGFTEEWIRTAIFTLPIIMLITMVSIRRKKGESR